MLAKLLAALAALALLVVAAAVSAVAQKSTLVWPVLAPTRVTSEDASYAAAGWTVSSPFGWRADPERPGAFALHDGVDLAGPTFCDGCPVPPIGDVVVVAVGWDQADDPLNSGAGVVVDMRLRHEEEAGTVKIRYGHLQPYRAYVRTRSCTRTVDCPRYRLDGAARVSLTCAGEVVVTESTRGVTAFAYAAPGTCTARVAWPRGYRARGATVTTFDQQIVPGEYAADAAITFNAEHEPPPTPMPSPAPTPEGGL